MSRGIEDSLKRQKQFLKTAIEESSKKEKDRLKRLTIAKTKSDQEQLLQRFTLERQLDQQRIEQLTTDYLTLKGKYQSGELNNIEEVRLHSGRKKEVIQELLPNRFAGLENRNGEIFYADIVHKFDHHDQKFQMKQSRQPFDALKETKKVKIEPPIHSSVLILPFFRQLRLLNEKRDLLNRLITIQSQENKAKNVIAPFSITSSQANRQYDQRSVYSDNVSSITAASYATFASKQPAPVRRGGPPPVPRLQLPGGR